MEILKNILSILWIVICFIFKCIWWVIAWFWEYVIVWAWDHIVEYIELSRETPKTRSGSWDRRFKSSRELNRKEKGCGIIFAVIFAVASVVALLIGGITGQFGYENDKIQDDTTSVDSLEKSKKDKDMKTLNPVDTLDFWDTIYAIDTNDIVDTVLFLQSEFDEVMPCDMDSVADEKDDTTGKKMDSIMDDFRFDTELLDTL